MVGWQLVRYFVHSVYNDNDLDKKSLKVYCEGSSSSEVGSVLTYIGKVTTS